MILPEGDTMKINQLKYFLAIEKCRSFAEAAEEMFISQSTLSKQIKALEEEIGLVLINRDARKVYLTEAGKTFSFYAARILKECSKMNLELQKYYSDKGKTINFYSIPILTQYGMIDRIIEFQKIYPDISVNVVEQSTPNGIVNAILNDEADIYVMRTCSVPKCDLEVYPLFEDEVVMMVGEDHKFATREEIDLSEASNEYFLLIGVGTDTFRMYVNICHQAGFQPRTQNKDLSIDSIIKLVAEGEGVTLLTQTVAEYAHNRKAKIIRLKNRPTLSTAMLARKDDNGTKTFIEYILRGSNSC
jgi:DNA-binding transcriptional LysR family regulator